MFEEPEDPSNRSFFSEIISSVSDVKFSHSGRYMLTRDYLTVKVWDLNMEARPIETYQVGPCAVRHTHATVPAWQQLRQFVASALKDTLTLVSAAGSPWRTHIRKTAVCFFLSFIKINISLSSISLPQVLGSNLKLFRIFFFLLGLFQLC